MSPGRRAGLTLIESLMALIVFFAVTGVLLPAVQKTRAVADNAACQEHLKRIALATLDYERAHGKLPPRATASPEHGWFNLILPFTGEEAVARKIHRDVPYYDPANRAAISTHLAVTQCPATPHQNRTVAGSTAGVSWTASASDYAGNGGIFPKVMERGLLPPDTDRWTVFANETVRPPLRLADIGDGTSNTLMLAEMAGRNEAWFAGVRNVEHPQDPVRGPWAAPNYLEVRGHSPDGKLYPGPCAVNCSNFSGIYAFHPLGANVAACDGTVRFLRQGMNIMILYALCSHAGGEVINADDW